MNITCVIGKNSIEVRKRQHNMHIRNNGNKIRLEVHTGEQVEHSSQFHQGFDQLVYSLESL